MSKQAILIALCVCLSACGRAPPIEPAQTIVDLPNNVEQAGALSDLSDERLGRAPRTPASPARLSPQRRDEPVVGVHVGLGAVQPQRGAAQERQRPLGGP